MIRQSLILYLLGVATAWGAIPSNETPDYWRDVGRRAIARAQAATPPAHGRNVILFIGDGMGVTTLTAARILQGQQHGGSGEENALSFERFPYTAMSKTYTVDAQTPESAGTMTAMMTGVKTRSGSLSVDQVVMRGDCQGSAGHELPTLLEQAADAGMATGVVSTARITHATPAATYAHVADRDWETDANIDTQAKAQGCRDIAKQLVEFDHGKGLTVALGGGRAMFYPQSAHDIEDPATSGRRTDGKDLVAQWQTRYPTGAYVWNNQQFAALDLAKTPRLLGLFNADHMAFEADRARDAGGEPSLAAMTTTAITMLRRAHRGYFLMVEAGRIDHGHHAGNAYRALTDTVALSDAVAAAAAMTSDRDTTIIVTADHSHTFNMVGYPARGNPILGLVRDDKGALMKDAANLPYTTLSYGNGPGYTGASAAQPQGSKHFPHLPLNAQKQVEYRGITAGRPDLSNVNTQDPNYLQEATVPLGAETHGGEDVVIFARGPGAQWVHGVLEQNVIYWIMREALGARLSAVHKRPAR